MERDGWSQLLLRGWSGLLGKVTACKSEVRELSSCVNASVLMKEVSLCFTGSYR